MTEIHFNSNKEWEVIKSEIFKKNPEYSSPARELLLKLQDILSQIDFITDNMVLSELIVEYIGYKEMYFSFVSCQN